MRSSSLGLVLLVAAWGCGRTAATPPIPPTPVPVSRGSSEWGGAERRVPSAIVAPGAPDVLDSSEAITPEELASIPDPVLAKQPAAPHAPPRAPVRAPPRARTGDGRRWIWRVQVFASPELTQADRIAKEASSRFGEPFVIEFEGALYKVRLGAFASEALAQALRERAVQEGFPGAFRMRSLESTTNSFK
jgi:hypothetical protein